MNIVALTYSDYMSAQDDLRIYLTKCHKFSGLQPADIEWSIQAGERIPLVFLDEDKPIGMMTLELDSDCVHITTLAGDLPKGWREHILTVMSNIAKEQGKKFLQCNGRGVWLRVLRSIGAFQHGEFTRVEIT